MSEEVTVTKEMKDKWVKCIDTTSDSIYYYNSITGDSATEEPEDYFPGGTDPRADATTKIQASFRGHKARKEMKKSAASPPLEAEKKVQPAAVVVEPVVVWVEAFDPKQKKKCWFNTGTNETVYVKPADFVDGSMEEQSKAALKIQSAHRAKEAKKTVGAKKAASPNAVKGEGKCPWIQGFDPQRKKPYWCNARTELSSYEKPGYFVPGTEMAFPRFWSALTIQCMVRVHNSKKKVGKLRKIRDEKRKKLQDKQNRQRHMYEDKVQYVKNCRDKLTFLQTANKGEYDNIRALKEACLLIGDELLVVENRMQKLAIRLEQKLGDDSIDEGLKEAVEVMKPLNAKITVACRHAALADVTLLENAWIKLVEVSTCPFIQFIEPKMAGITNVKGLRLSFESAWKAIENNIIEKRISWEKGKEPVFEPVVMGKDDYFGFHLKVSEACTLVKKAYAQMDYATKAYQDYKDAARQEMERLLMKQEDSKSSKARDAVKSRKDDQEAREIFLEVCKVAWSDGFSLRNADQAHQEKLKQHGRDVANRERQERAIKAQMEKDRRYINKSPWEACKGGVSIEFLQDLIKEESDRRRYQEGRVFHIDDVDHVSRESLLRNAVWFGHKHLVQYLIDRGADVNKIDSEVNKITILHEAARAGLPHVIQILIEQGADITAVDSSGETALHVAARVGKVDVVSSLLRYERDQPLPTWTMVCCRNYKGRLASEVTKKAIISAYLKDYEVRGKNKISTVAQRQQSQRQRQ